MKRKSSKKYCVKKYLLNASDCGLVPAARLCVHSRLCSWYELGLPGAPSCRCGRRSPRPPPGWRRRGGRARPRRPAATAAAGSRRAPASSQPRLVKIVVTCLAFSAALSNTSPDEQNMKLRRESVIFGIMKINLVLPDLICNSSHRSYLRQSLEIMMGV